MPSIFRPTLRRELTSGLFLPSWLSFKGEGEDGGKDDDVGDAFGDAATGAGAGGGVRAVLQSLHFVNLSLWWVA